MSGTLGSIYDNVNLGLRVHVDALARLQEQVSTGSCINRASDGPSAAYQILGLNSQGRGLDNYMTNISNTVSTLNMSLALIDGMVGVFVEKKANLTGVSGTSGVTGRELTAGGINEALEQILSLANTQYTDRYLFGGGDTSSAPYVATRSDGKITSVSYQGSYENRNIELAPGVESSAFYVGDDTFRSDDRSSPTFILEELELGDTGVAAGTGTSSVTGYTWLTVTHDTGDSEYDISIDGGVTVVSIADDGSDANVNQAITNAAGQVLYIDTTNIAEGVELVEVSGTHDIFNSLITARDILENTNGLSEIQIDELKNSTIEAVEEVRSLLVEKSIAVGSRIGFLDNISGTLGNIKFNTEEETMNLEQADIAQLAIDITRREVLYQMSLSVAGRLLSMSLLDFI